jgi:predicted HTH transcriptional regulator
MLIHILFSTNRIRYKHMNVHNNKIVEYILKNRVVTSSDVARLLKISWNTADKYLLELYAERKIDRIKKSGVNLWLMK